MNYSNVFDGAMRRMESRGWTQWDPERDLLGHIASQFGLDRTPRHVRLKDERLVVAMREWMLANEKRTVSAKTMPAADLAAYLEEWNDSTSRQDFQVRTSLRKARDRALKAEGREAA